MPAGSLLGIALQAQFLKLFARWEADEGADYTTPTETTLKRHQASVSLRLLGSVCIVAEICAAYWRDLLNAAYKNVCWQQWAFQLDRCWDTPFLDLVQAALWRSLMGANTLKSTNFPLFYCFVPIFST